MDAGANSGGILAVEVFGFVLFLAIPNLGLLRYPFSFGTSSTHMALNSVPYLNLNPFPHFLYKNFLLLSTFFLNFFFTS